MKEELVIKAEPKEISLIINIMNKIWNMKEDWMALKFNGTSIMVPKGYFKGASYERKEKET